MNEMFDAEFLQIFHAGRSTGYHEDFFTVADGFVGRRSEFGIFVVARAEHDDVGSGFACGSNAVFNGAPTQAAISPA